MELPVCSLSTPLQKTVAQLALQADDEDDDEVCDGGGACTLFLCSGDSGRMFKLTHKRCSKDISILFLEPAVRETKAFGCGKKKPFTYH